MTDYVSGAAIERQIRRDVRELETAGGIVESVTLAPIDYRALAAHIGHPDAPGILFWHRRALRFRVYPRWSDGPTG